MKSIESNGKTLPRPIQGFGGQDKNYKIEFSDKSTERVTINRLKAAIVDKSDPKAVTPTKPKRGQSRK